MKLPKAESHLEALLLAQLRAAGLPEPERQHKLIPGRRFAADFCWVEERLYCEVDGGTWAPKSRHTSGSGVESDCEKSSLAAGLGFRQVRVTGRQVESGQALAWIQAALEGGN